MTADQAASPKETQARGGARKKATRSTNSSKEESGADVLINYDGPRPDEELLEAVKIECKAFEQGSVERIYQMIWDGEDVNQRNELGYAPLAVAAAAGNAPLVSLLLERDADPTLKSIYRSELALHYAVRVGHGLICQLLSSPTAARGMIDHPNILGWPPLHLGVMAGHALAVSVLARHGADLNSRNLVNGGGGSPLHVAARMGSVEGLEALLDRDADVDALDALGRGALHAASARADYACVSLLLRSKADPSRTGTVGKTPLQVLPAHADERLVTLMQAFARPGPALPRTDARFDRWDPRDVDKL